MPNCCKTGGSSDTGKGKQILFGTARRYYAQYRIAADGTKNKIDGSTFKGSQSDWDALTKNPDPTKRLYPIGELEEVTNERAESIKQTFASGTNLIIEKGPRTVTAFIPEVDNVYAGIVDTLGCEDIHIYASDVCGNFQGYQPDKSTQFLFGARVQKGTFESNPVFAADGTAQGAQIAFEFSKLMLDKEIRQFNADELEVSPNDIDGLIGVDIAVSGESTTGFVGVATYCYGTAKTKQPLIGAALGSWSLFNDTSGLSVTIISANESPDGTYTFTYAAQTSGDVLTLSLDIATGFNLSTTTIETP